MAVASPSYAWTKRARSRRSNGTQPLIALPHRGASTDYVRFEPDTRSFPQLRHVFGVTTVSKLNCDPNTSTVFYLPVCRYGTARAGDSGNFPLNENRPREHQDNNARVNCSALLEVPLADASCIVRSTASLF